MRFSNKVRLLLILHLCGANLLVLGKTHDGFMSASDSVRKPWSGDYSEGYDQFPQIPYFLPLDFNQTSLMLNMTDCQMLNPDDEFDAICDSPNWQSQVDRDQFPGQLRYLHIRNTSLSVLQPDDFKGKTIIVLEMSDNILLTNIHSETFTPISHLLYALVLNRNGFRVLKNESLFKPFAQLHKLAHLILEDNPLLNLVGVGKDHQNDDDDQAPVLPRLEYLSFKGSDLQRLEPDIFWPLRNSINLTELNLQSCNLRSISSHTFRNLINIKHIDFYNNPKLLMPTINIYETPFLLTVKTINTETFTSMGLGNTNLVITPYFLMYMFKDKLKRLNLSENGFEALGHFADIFSLPIFPPMAGLETLVLRRCRILSIHENTFRSLYNLKHLDLQGNSLTTIPDGVLLPTLETLDVSYQMNIAFNWPKFTNMTRLRSLSVSGLVLTTLKAHALDGLTGLETLKLDNTYLTTISDSAFQCVPNLKHLDLSNNNNLNGLRNDTLNGLDKLEYLSLENSSRAFQDQNNDRYLLEFSLDGLRNLKVLNLRCALNSQCKSSEDFVSPLDPDYLKAIVNIEELDLSDNGLSYWTDDRFINNKHLWRLYLRSNSMTRLTAGLLASFARLREVDFRDNPLDCDDKIIEFVQMAENQNLEVVGWYNGTGYTCWMINGSAHLELTFQKYYDDYMAGLTFDDPWAPSWLVSLLGSLGIAVVAFGTGYFLHRERFTITYKLLSTWHRYGPKQVAKTLPLRVKHFDAFISYCHEDQDWVSESLLPKLEGERNFRCCVHERDFDIGVTVLQNIIDCVDKSRVFVVILSPGYVKSTWCMFELFLAQSRMKDNNDNLIVIVKHPIANISRLDKRLQVILKLWTYLEWPLKSVKDQSLFWKRLSFCIAQQSASRHPGESFI
jgi:Leucine-rich repeat (LRR) protein